MKAIATVGSISSHGGHIINCDPLTKVEGRDMAFVGSLHFCPLGDPPHGITPIVKGAVKTWVNGKQVATVVAIAGCGAVIQTGAAKSFAE